MSPPLTREEEENIQRALAASRTPTCPRCGTPMDVTDVPPRRDISYVRHRALVLCPLCKTRGVVDRP